MINKATEPRSLQPIFEGFRQLTFSEQAEYLKYLALVVERQTGSERRLFLRFKSRLEREMNPGAARICENFLESIELEK